MSLQKKSLKRTQRRALRIRSKIKASGKLRVSVFRSLRHFYAQIIDETNSTTLVSCSSHVLGTTTGDKKEKAFAVGKMLAERAREKGITAGVLDRGPYKFHGRVEAFARGLRETGFEI